MSAAPLTFAALDGIAFAARRGRLNQLAANGGYSAATLGPFMEWRQLSGFGLLPQMEKTKWLQLGPFAALQAALGDGKQQWIGGGGQAAGFFRTGTDFAEDETAFVGFGIAVQKAAAALGFHRIFAAQFAAALEEMVGNVYEHSGRPASGIAAFRVGDGEFEFVVADEGIGVLESLRSGPDV